MITPAVESDFDGTFPFVSKFCRTTSGRMAYVDEGTGDPIVLLHGNPIRLILDFLNRHRQDC